MPAWTSGEPPCSIPVITSLLTFASNGTGFDSPHKTWTGTGSFNWNTSGLTSGDHDKDGKHDIGVLCRAGTTADGRRIDSLFTFTSTGTDIKAPAKHRTGSVVRPTASVVKCHAHACAGGQRGDLTLHSPPRQAGGLLMRSCGRLSMNQCTVN